MSWPHWLSPTACASFKAAILEAARQAADFDELRALGATSEELEGLEASIECLGRTTIRSASDWHLELVARLRQRLLERRCAGAWS